MRLALPPPSSADTLEHSTSRARIRMADQAVSDAGDGDSSALRAGQTQGSDRRHAVQQPHARCSTACASLRRGQSRRLVAQMLFQMVLSVVA